MYNDFTGQLLLREPTPADAGETEDREPGSTRPERLPMDPAVALRLLDWARGRGWVDPKPADPATAERGTTSSTTVGDGAPSAPDGSTRTPPGDVPGSAPHADADADASDAARASA
jgi:hypothetical protein